MKLFETHGPEEEPFEDLPPDPVSESQARSSLHGREFDSLAVEFLKSCGATVVETYLRVENYPLDALVEGRNGRRFYVDAHGSPDQVDRSQAGMRRQDTMLKFGFKALRLHDRRSPHPLLLLTSHMPKAGTSSSFLLTEVSHALWDAVAIIGDLGGQQRLRHYFEDDPPPDNPLPSPWRAVQLTLDQYVFDATGDDDA